MLIKSNCYKAYDFKSMLKFVQAIIFFISHNIFLSKFAKNLKSSLKNSKLSKISQYFIFLATIAHLLADILQIILSNFLNYKFQYKFNIILTSLQNLLNFSPYTLNTSISSLINLKGGING